MLCGEATAGRHAVGTRQPMTALPPSRCGCRHPNAADKTIERVIDRQSH